MARLSSASKTSAQKVADKIAKSAKTGKGSTTETHLPVVSTPANITQLPISEISLDVPGLTPLSPSNVPELLPQFDISNYQIEDPLNPPESLPQATQSQFDRGMGIYEGTQRALKLTGAAFDTTRERFNVVGKRAKAIGAGVIAATEIEKVRGNFIDYQSQQQATEQKIVTLDVSRSKTVIDRTVANYSKAELEEKLKQAEIKSEEAKLKSAESQGKLSEFQQKLGSYLPAK
jgi:hypothetical protein